MGSNPQPPLKSRRQHAQHHDNRDRQPFGDPLSLILIAKPQPKQNKERREQP